ncbi:MAG: 6-phosphofructokinase [Myxococcota bacterium]
MAHTAVIGQSGGPTAVINQSLVGCIEALRASGEVDTIYGARNGVRGMVEDRFVELQALDSQRLARLAHTPSAALGSSRDKPDASYAEKIFRAFEKRSVRYFFYIGGNDSSDTCRIINELAAAQGYDLRSFHIPKTVDNDLVGSDHTPGFPSAARFVAAAFTGDNLDNQSLPGVKINVVMGRHAGFLTAASVMARQRAGDGPHLIYVPEIAFDIESFVADVERTYREQGRCQIAVSEGIHDANETPIVTTLASDVETDAHGNVQLSGTGALGDHLAQLIKSRMDGVRVRADTFGYLQRCFPLAISEIDQREARNAAAKAVECALAGEKDGSIAITRASEDPYRAGFERIELGDVAAKTRTLPEEWRRGSNDIADGFLDYLAPLIGELPAVEHI